MQHVSGASVRMQALFCDLVVNEYGLHKTGTAENIDVKLCLMHMP